MKLFAVLSVAVALLGAPAISQAQAQKAPTCRDTKGHFTKCPATPAPGPAPAAKPTPASAKPAPCRDAKGHFTACGGVAPSAAPSKPPVAANQNRPSAASASAMKNSPAGATAQCRDGTYSMSQHRSGTCSHHGGVATWY